jgi:prepilin-type N-terminal cleavage/methylation domain-containing protein
MPKTPVCRRRGFTLIELIVTIFILTVVAGLVVAATSQSRAQARALTCQNNQRSIATAMLAYFTDHGKLPTDGDSAQLADQLADYIAWPDAARQDALPETWRCPNDSGGKHSNSYEEFYVQRRTLKESKYFVLGCPRHDDTEWGYINLRGMEDTGRSGAGAITVTDPANVPVTRDRPVEGKAMKFSDGSTATVANAKADHTMKAVASFRNDDGTLYTIIRVGGEGNADFDVTPGSQFEVITPVAIIGVRGTGFRVETADDYTKVFVTEGHVVVEDKATGVTHQLLEGDSVEIGTPPEEDKYVPLELKSTGSKYYWKIRNKNDFPIYFQWWEFDPSSNQVNPYYRGCATMPANCTAYLRLSRKIDGLRIYYQLPGQSGYTTAEALSKKYSDDDH